MRRILVTGGAGNIGGSLARKLAEDQDNAVVIVDNLSTGNISKLPPNTRQNWKFIKCDVNNYGELAAIMVSNKFDYVFHYAAIVGVERTLANPINVLNDIEGIRNVLNLCKNTGVKRVFYSSSSEVYGEPVEIPQREMTTPLNSRLPYAIVKNVGEAYCRSFQQEYGMDYTIFRFFNTYGPLQTTDFVISRFVEAARCGAPLTIYGDGSQTRTFCYIADNMEVTVRALYEDKFLNDVVNVGSDEEVSIRDLAMLVKKISGSESPVVHLPPLAEGDMSRRKPDITKMREVLQRDLTPLEKGLAEVLRSLQE